MERTKLFLIKNKETGEVVDEVNATSIDSLLEDYDYSPEYFDITEVA